MAGPTDRRLLDLERDDALRQEGEALLAEHAHEDDPSSWDALRRFADALFGRPLPERDPGSRTPPRLGAGAIQDALPRASRPRHSAAEPQPDWTWITPKETP